MFTGIVQGKAQVIAIEEKEQLKTLVVALPVELTSGLTLGASVAHNGVCLTVTRISEEHIHVDVMQETLRLTNLATVKVGDWLNVERAARFGDEIGGHAMSGHVMAMAKIVDIVSSQTNRQIWFEVPQALLKYILTKGYIGIDGISLTIGEVRQSQFCVNLIPETIARTTLGQRAIGEHVNIEIDPQTQAVVDTVERVLAEQATQNAAMHQGEGR